MILFLKAVLACLLRNSLSSGTGLSNAAKMQMTNIDDAILHINASDEKGIDTVRSKIKPVITIAGINVIILDEFDAILKASQHALRGIMEDAEKMKSPKLFVITANYVNKIIDPIISRCGGQAYLFPVIPFKLMQPSLIDICRKEGITEFRYNEEITTPEAEKEEFAKFFESLYQRANGDMRKALKFLEANVEEIEDGKALDLSSSIVDLTTNAFYTQLDKILLSADETTFKLLLDSIDELIYKKEGNVWDRTTFFKEAFTWLKNRAETFSHLTLLDMASIIAKFENRMNNGGNTIQIQISAMVAEMRKYLITNKLLEIE